MIKVQNLSKSFGPKVAVNGVSFTVERGEVLGFLGPNGAGKTTTIKMLNTLAAITEGKAIVDGKAVAVSGGAYFEGSAEIACDFECRKRWGDLLLRRHPEGARVPRHILEDEGVPRGLRRGRQLGHGPD